MNFVGIDIGSTSAKVVVIDENKNIKYKKIMPTGWNSKETSLVIKNLLEEAGIDFEKSNTVATGYGRISVPYANKQITEITCHGKGACELSGENNITVIDIGGQDTKIIAIEDGNVTDFVMNDKCSAGTGKFLEVIADSSGLTLEELFSLAKKGEPIEISSMCTVFAQSEVISLIGRGESKENIAAGVVDSIIRKVVTQCSRPRSSGRKFYLTGGFSNNDYIVKSLEESLIAKVGTHEDGRFAGAIGAALCAMNLKR